MSRFAPGDGSATYEFRDVSGNGAKLGPLEAKRSRLWPVLLVSGGLVAGVYGPGVAHGLAAHRECLECDARAVRAVVRQVQAERAAQAARVTSGGIQ